MLKPSWGLHQRFLENVYQWFVVCFDNCSGIPDNDLIEPLTCEKDRQQLFFNLCIILFRLGQSSRRIANNPVLLINGNPKTKRTGIAFNCQGTFDIVVLQGFDIGQE